MSKVFEFKVVATAEFFAGGEIDPNEYYKATGQKLEDATPDDAYDYLADRRELGFELNEILDSPAVVDYDEYEA